MPGRRGVVAADRGDEPARQIGRRIQPDEAREDDHGADQRRRAREFGEGMAADARDDRARLQAGDQEHHAFDQIIEEIPEEDALQPRRRADQPEPVPADVEAGGDGREHARAADRLGRPVGEERGQHRKRDLDAGIADPAAQPQHEPADADPPGDLADDDRRESARRLRRREHPEAHRGDREAIEHQRGRVVGEPLALEDDEQPAGNREPARDRQRRERVGRRDDRAEHEAERPGHADFIRGAGARRLGFALACRRAACYPCRYATYPPG